MGLNIDDPEVNRLVAEVAAATGETETEVVRRALRDRKDSLGLPSVEERVEAFLRGMERDVWSKLPPDALGKPLSREEEEEILGYGPDGC